MARIVVMLHPQEQNDIDNWSISKLCQLWREQGHAILITRDFDNLPDGDLGIMHVDASKVPKAYCDAARRYPKTINIGALDITKRRVSKNLLLRGDDWTGPIVIKTDRNCGGKPEHKLEAEPSRWQWAKMRLRSQYWVLPSVSLVPRAVWDNPEWVVERFMPEKDERGYGLRIWMFLGDREVCRRVISKHRIVKHRGMLGVEPAEIPEELRAERERLGIDYGKFDFVMHEGKAVLLDANKTPGKANMNPKTYINLAEGIAPMLTGAAS